MAADEKPTRTPREVRDKYAPLRCSIVESRKLNSVTLEAETLFFRIVARCDALAQYEADPIIVACSLYAQRIANKSVSPDAIGPWFDELEKADLIRRYISGDHRYLVIVNPCKFHRLDMEWDVRYPLAPKTCIESDTSAERLRAEFVTLKESKVKESKVKEEQHIPPEAVAAAWNALGRPFPRVLKMSKARTAHARNRLSDPWWRDNWLHALDRMKASGFCRGESGRGWIADIDFFLRPDSVTKILEGKYDDRRASKGGDDDAKHAQGF